MGGLEQSAKAASENGVVFLCMSQQQCKGVHLCVVGCTVVISNVQAVLLVIGKNVQLCIHGLQVPCVG